MGPSRICQGNCNARWRDAQGAYTAAMALYDPLDAAQERPAPPTASPWPGEPVWCGRDSSRILAELAELDDLGALLAAAADGHRGAGAGQRVSGSPASLSPSPAADDLDELVSVLTGWQEAYSDVAGWPSPPRRGVLSTRLTACVAWLRFHAPARDDGSGLLAHDGIAADFGGEVMAWHRRLAGAARAGTRRLRKPLRCPGCGLLTLLWTEGEDRVGCSMCPRILTYPEYELLVAQAAGMGAAALAAA